MRQGDLSTLVTCTDHSILMTPSEEWSRFMWAFQVVVQCLSMRGLKGLLRESYDRVGAGAAHNRWIIQQKSNKNAEL